jgi:galactoside O-acetyltransferase
MITSFYSEEEIKQIGFKSIGKNVLISKKASFYSPETISIGNNVRIDDFCILSGEISLGSYIHISAYCALYGAYGIYMDDFTGLSPRTTIFSATDDFSGDYLIGPMIDKKYTNVIGGKVYIGKFSQIGANSVVLPNVTIEEGVAIGALSLVNKSLPAWGIYAGIPVKFIKPRNKGLLILKHKFLNE